MTLGRRDARQNPDEIFSKVLFRFKSYRDCPIAGHVCFNLNVNKASAFLVAAENVCVGSVP